LSRLCPAGYGLLCALAFLALALPVLDDYGITWDERLHFRTASTYWDAIASGRLAFEPGEFSGSLQYYGPFFDLVGEASYRLFHRDWGWLAADNARHLHLVLLGAATVGLICLLGVRLAGPRAGLLAAGFLAGTPRFFGHCFNNPKDLPLAFVATLCVALFVLRLESGRGRWSAFLALAGAIGFASRITYLIVPLFLLGYLFLGAVLDRLQAVPRARRKGFPPDIILALFCSVPLGIAFWPYLWADPLVRLGEVYEFFAHHPIQAQVFVLFGGERYVAGDDLPFYYAPLMLLITTPLPVLLAAASGIISGLFRGRGPSARRPVLLAACWFAGGVAFFSLPGQRVYDGIRHFLFVLPALALLAGLGLDWVCGKIGVRAAAVLVAGLAAWLLVGQVDYHPYQTCFYNRLVGGARGAAGDFPLDYWGNAYKGGCRWLNRTAPPGSVILVPGPVPPSLARYYLRDDLRMITLGSSPVSDYDYSLYTIRQYDPLQVEKKPVFAGTAGGQPVVKVHEW